MNGTTSVSISVTLSKSTPSHDGDRSVILQAKTEKHRKWKGGTDGNTGGAWYGHRTQILYGALYNTHSAGSVNGLFFIYEQVVL